MDFYTMPRTSWHLYAVELFTGTYPEPCYFCKSSFVSCRLSIMHRTASIYSRELFVKYFIKTPF